MFRLVKNHEIAVTNTKHGIQMKQELIPKMVSDLSEMINENVQHIYVSFSPNLHYN